MLNPVGLISRLYRLRPARIPLPCICIICHQAIFAEISLCDYCLNRLPRNTRQCCGCGLPIFRVDEDEQWCGQCVISPPVFDFCNTSFLYQPPVSKLITGFKFNANFAAGKVLSSLLADDFVNHYTAQQDQSSRASFPQLLLPVPLHPRRLRDRGFNQATEIAKLISSRTGLKVKHDLVLRKRDTASQSLLGANERSRNLDSAFEVNTRTSVIGTSHVAIIDDVVTTTVTVSAIARLLKKAGVERIDIWAIARASLRS